MHKRYRKGMDMKPLVIGDLTAKIPVIQGGMGVGISLSRLAGKLNLCYGYGIPHQCQGGKHIFICCDFSGNLPLFPDAGCHQIFQRGVPQV